MPLTNYISRTSTFYMKLHFFNFKKIINIPLYTIHCKDTTQTEIMK